MSALCEKLPSCDRDVLARLNRAVLLGLLGSGLVACGFGATIFDVGRWFSAW